MLRMVLSGSQQRPSGVVAGGCNGLDWGRSGPGLQVERQSPKNGNKKTANNADFALAA
jgi:hypothetical protein